MTLRKEKITSKCSAAMSSPGASVAAAARGLLAVALGEEPGLALDLPDPGDSTLGDAPRLADVAFPGSESAIFFFRNPVTVSCFDRNWRVGRLL